VPQQERDRVVAQIAELKATLRLAQSYDVREAIRLAIDANSGSRNSRSN
jgi:hypothetical protein